MTMELGFNMAGTEEKFEEMIFSAMSNSIGDFRYLEIGVARGDTLMSVSALSGGRSTCLGIDLSTCPYFDYLHFSENCKKPHTVGVGYWDIGTPEWGTTVMLMACHDYGIPVALKWDFCLIDGCHGMACSTRDFLRIEKSIVQGGIVAFHDACEEDQGKDFQPHCQEPINVRTALKHMGLLDNTRKGWETAGEVHGDKSRSGNGFAFFKKLPV